MKKLLFSIVILFSLNIYSQKERRVITTAVPFLLISSDARASGVGEQGVATSFDNFSQHWNPSKYVFKAKFIRAACLLFGSAMLQLGVSLL
mgnify:CR=1 FL=1